MRAGPRDRPEATSREPGPGRKRRAEEAGRRHGAGGAAAAATAQPPRLPPRLQPHDRALLPALRLQPQLPDPRQGRGIVPGQLCWETGALQPPPDGCLRPAHALHRPAQDIRLRGGCCCSRPRGSGGQPRNRGPCPSGAQRCQRLLSQCASGCRRGSLWGLGKELPGSHRAFSPPRRKWVWCQLLPLGLIFAPPPLPEDSPAS